MIDQNLKHWQIGKSGQISRDGWRIQIRQRDCIRIEITGVVPGGRQLLLSHGHLSGEGIEDSDPHENYDWPRRKRRAAICWRCSAVGLRFNTGIRDEEFNK